MKNLDKQVYIYSVSTDVFFTEDERNIKLTKDRFHDLKRLANLSSSLAKEINELKLSKSKDKNNKISTLQRQLDYYYWLKDNVFKDKDDLSNASLKRELNIKIEEFDGVRTLNHLRLNQTQVIALFESTLTRQLKMEINKLSDKLIVVEIYNYEVFKNLLENGFNFNDKKFIYWSSSSGQIRDKKAVFIEQDDWNTIGDSITAGLSIDDINSHGGMSVNKFLAYKALASSASEKWENFNIDKCIVVDDVKVELKNRTVDYISRDKFEVERKPMIIELEITDGCGMCLESVSKKSFQFRLPWMKGLLSPVPFNEFANENNTYTVTDIYGDEHDIRNVEIIYFKSQFKMWKHFKNWDEYKENFKKYNCEAAFMNLEEDNISNAKLNYQYLQSLVYVDDKDLFELAEMTNDDLNNMGSDVDTMLRVLGADDSNENKNEFQEALNLYPALLNDKNSKMAIKNRKKKMLKEARAGKLSMDAKYTYILPDWVYVMESILGFDNPKGLLANGEVYCNLYDEGKVDLLRAPSLSFEHVIRQNVNNEEMRKWFVTKGVYISADDQLPKILQADFDGDRILISPNKTIVRLAEENAHKLDVVPLEYEMGVSKPKLINPQSIFESLQMAFKANIGIISNTISKVFNKDDFDPETDYKLIKQLCSYNNHVIDMAKTLDDVKPPENVKADWNEYNQQLLPYFFTYAKDKENVLDKNKSTVNRLEDVLIDKRLTFKSVVGKFDYKKLMWTPNVKDDAYIIDEETDKKIIDTYTYLDQNKRYYSNDEEEFDDKKKFIYITIREKLLEIHPEAHKVVDVLVRYLFNVKDSEYKRTLWESFGEELVKAIKKNVLNEVECITCGEAIDNPKQRQVRCDDCQKEYRKRQDRERKRKVRARLDKMSA